MRKRGMKGQNKSFILFCFYFSKEANASALLLCCQVGLVVHDAGEEPIKAHSIQGAKEQLLQDKQGPSPPSSRPRTWPLTPWLPAGQVMWLFISPSFLKFDLRESDLNSFCRTNKLREISEVDVITLDAIHQPFPTLTSGSGRTV